MPSRNWERGLLLLIAKHTSLFHSNKLLLLPLKRSWILAGVIEVKISYPFMGILDERVAAVILWVKCGDDGQPSQPNRVTQRRQEQVPKYIKQCCPSSYCQQWLNCCGCSRNQLR